MSEWDIAGKVCLITGATSGLGKETAVQLASSGAQVIITGYRPEHSQKALEEVRQRSGNPNVELLLADLSSQADVLRLIWEFKLRYSSLHVLIGNAGVLLPEREETVDGYEKTFAINHLSHFMLIRRLLDLLIHSTPSRIITVATASHQYGRINLDDLQSKQAYDGLVAYNQSKLANLMCTLAFAREFAQTGVTANCVQPTDADTNLYRQMPELFRIMTSLFFAPPQKAANSVVRLAIDPTLTKTNGAYFDETTIGRAAEQAYDQTVQSQLMFRCEELTNLRKGNLPA